VCDIIVVKVFQVDLYKMYNYSIISFQPKNFLEFTNVGNTSCKVI
jgi:hypothetical protein